MRDMRRASDISYNESSRLITMRLVPNVNEGVKNFSVFPTATATSFVYNTNTIDSPPFRCISVSDYIQRAMTAIFGAQENTIFLPSKSNLQEFAYSEFVYDNLEPNRRQFVMAIPTFNEGIAPSADGQEAFIGTGTITAVRLGDDPPPPTNRDDTRPVFPEEYQINGTGTSFLTEVAVGDEIVSAQNGIVFEVTSVASNTQLLARSDIFPTGKTVVDHNFEIFRRPAPGDIPALQTLKELAGIEGSVFGTGFSTNFYFNRLRRDGIPTITLDYDQVTEFKPSGFNLSLGNSYVAQRADYRRQEAKEYGQWPFLQNPRYRGFPNLVDFTSITSGNRNASKGLEISLAPAYPFLNKGIAPLATPNRFIGVGIETDTSLESALTRNGLTSYFQALNNTSGGLVIEFSILGAFTLKPWQTFQFDSRAPEKYQNRQFRITSVSYDLVNNIQRIKGYQIDTVTTPVFPENPVNLGINYQFGEGLLPQGLYTAVQAQIGQAVGSALGVVIETAQGVQGALTSIPVRYIGESFPGQIYAYAGFFVSILNPITLSRQNLRLTRDYVYGDAFIFVEAVTLDTLFPAGSYVYLSQEQISAGIVTSESSVRLFAESTSIGELITNVSGVVTHLPVRLFTRIRAGQDLRIDNGRDEFIVTSAANYDVGVYESGIDIRDLDGIGSVVNAQAGSGLKTDGVALQAYIQIDPGNILLEASNSIVLKINSGGEVVSSLGLFADPDIGGIIDIRAGQVKINGIIFTEGTDPITDPGDIATVNYVAGTSGWKIGGDGDAEFNNVVVRGSIDASNITGSVSIITGGAITGGASNLTYVIDDNGIDIQDFVTSSDNGGITIDSRTMSLANTVGTDQWTLSVRADEIFMQSPSATFGQTKINTGEIVLFDTSDDGLNIRIDVNGVETVRSLIVGGDADISGDTEISGDLYVGGKVFLDKQTTIDTGTDFPYTVDADDFYIRIEDGGTIGGTITLPTATGTGRVLVIKDTTGSAGSASFTVQRSGSDTIDGATSTSINTNFQTIRLIDAVSGKWELI
jgi:hypothetical protein